jgi:hypothetical protein
LPFKRNLQRYTADDLAPYVLAHVAASGLEVGLYKLNT